MIGTDGDQLVAAGGPAIILVEPQLGENIGMVARAMANFGLEDLRLVNPRDGWPSEKARAAASRADHVIDAVRLFGSVEEAVADLTYVLATTARSRDSQKPVRGPKSACAQLRGRITAGQPTGILFGRERFGLSNEEVGLADEIVTFPVNPAFASLNIAQAVLLMSYEWMQSSSDDAETPRFAPIEADPAEKGDLHRLLDHTEVLLDRLGYFRPPERRVALSEKLRTTLTKANFSRMEVHALHGVLRHVEHRLDGDGE
ncbi:RNA methyltransferase [Mangrovicella endophytica]|uniref:RNA methyltransferase n=1 Tax=Mangrovicella endophytica TaxID=2066697 RepID=UPI000C9E58D3|nr:RNA methyltransferase [Mangrovicella endophytica]